MNNKKIKTLLLGILLAVLLISLTIPVYANTENETIIYKKADNKYLIYYSELLNNAFQFAISNSSSTDISSLNFLNSAKDNDEETALNVAYVDQTNNPQNHTELYIWIKDGEGNLIKTAEKIELENALDNEIINLINTTTIANKNTDRIKIDTTQTNTRNAIVDGVDTTVTTGKILINAREGAKYYYKLLNANDNASDPGKLYNMADEINNYTGNAYGRLKLAKNFYDLYLAQTPQSDEWIEVENNEILQPEDTVTGDKYIVYIKEVKDDDSQIIDVKLLECIREENQGKNQKEETVKLPITYDNVILIIIFAVLILAILIVLFLKKRSSGKHGK